MSITPLPTPPSRSDPSNFATRADDFLGQLPTFATEANLLATEVNVNAAAASAFASTASTKANEALNSANSASASANYEAEWSSLTGALNMPASVSHNDSIWMLLVNLVDVTTSEPGVAVGQWLEILKPQPTGDVVGTSDTQTLTNKTLDKVKSIEDVRVISTGVTAVVSATYVLTASLTLVLPPSPVSGDWITVIDRSATTTSIIDRNGLKIMGLSENITLDIDNSFITLIYTDATRGWVII